MRTEDVRRECDLEWLRTASARLADPPSGEPADRTTRGDLPAAVSPSASVTTTFLGLLSRSPLEVAVDQRPSERLTSQLRAMVLMLADEPELADVCLRAMLASERSVSKRRRHIGAEVDRRIRAALGSGAWPEVVDLFGFALYGAVLQANYGAASHAEAANRLADLVAMVFSRSA